MSISRTEALPIVEVVIHEIHEALKDDNKVSLSEWLDIVKAAGEKAYQEYTDDDDV